MIRKSIRRKKTTELQDDFNNNNTRPSSLLAKKMKRCVYARKCFPCFNVTNEDFDDYMGGNYTIGGNIAASLQIEGVAKADDVVVLELVDEETDDVVVLDDSVAASTPPQGWFGYFTSFIF